jgi:hypothetical protein
VVLALLCTIMTCDIIKQVSKKFGCIDVDLLRLLSQSGVHDFNRRSRFECHSGSDTNAWIVAAFGKFEINLAKVFLNGLLRRIDGRSWFESDATNDWHPSGDASQ